MSKQARDLVERQSLECDASGTVPEVMETDGLIPFGLSPALVAAVCTARRTFRRPGERPLRV
jgi:hypothetical protein